MMSSSRVLLLETADQVIPIGYGKAVIFYMYNFIMPLLSTFTNWHFIVQQ